MTGAMRKAMAEKPEEFDPRAFLKAAVAAARDICGQRFEAFGSAGQASAHQAGFAGENRSAGLPSLNSSPYQITLLTIRRLWPRSRGRFFFH